LKKWPTFGTLAYKMALYLIFSLSSIHYGIARGMTIPPELAQVG